VRSRPSVLIAATLFLVGSAALIAWRRDDVNASALWSRMSRAPRAWPRRFTARVSWPTAYRACTNERRAGDDAVLERCGPVQNDDVVPRDLLGDAVRARQRATAARIHEAALVDLVWNVETAAGAERSVARLEPATRDAATARAALVDLSAAHLVADAHEGSAEHLLAAADAASRALQLAGADPAARFNQALALDRLSLIGEARAAWAAYLAIDSTSEWAAEARQRMNALIERSRPNPPWQRRALSVDSSAPPVDSFALIAPGEARVIAWEQLLPEWGSATLARDTATASGALRRAEAIAQTLERQRGDLTLRDAIHAIQGARRSTMEVPLARAHALFAHAQACYRAADYEGADSSFALIVASPRLPASLVQWAAVHRSATLAYRHRMADGEALARKTLASIDSVRAPALYGRASWVLGTILLRTARHDAGVDIMRMAQRSFTRAHERENAAATGSIVGEELLSLGNEVEAFAIGRQSLSDLERYPASVWHHNTLEFLLRAEMGARRFATARLVASEDERVTRAIGNPLYLAESMIGRARALLEFGDTVGERSAADAAHGYLDHTPPGNAQQQLAADLRIVEATDLARVGGRAAIALLDSSLAFFAPPDRAPKEANAIKLVPLYLARANAYMSAAAPDSARADLARAAREFDRRSDAVASVPERAALAMRARGVVDRLVSLLAERGRAREALGVVEWGRASFAARRRRIDLEAGGRAQLRDPALSLSFVGDTLFTWTIVADAVSMTRRVVSHGEVESRVVRVNEALEAGDSSTTVRDDLAWLYRMLAKPAIDALPDTAHRLTIVADDDIGQAPFAAFWNDDAQQFLVERVAPQFARALWTKDAPRRRAAEPVAALVGDPAFADRRFPLIGPLPGARAEVRAIRPLYRDARITEGASADTSALIRELEHASIVHFAGHTIFDERHPERSFLAASGGVLTAPRIGRLDLRGLELAVLSTCDASRAERSRAAGFSGITDAFLSAGADGVVGATWRVADERSMAAMSAFHRAYVASRDPATALRDAQLSLLRSPDAGLRSPATWAAYRYITRSTQ
jgi:CHAT domain-containing protein